MKKCIIILKHILTIRCESNPCEQDHSVYKTAEI